MRLAILALALGLLGACAAPAEAPRTVTQADGPATVPHARQFKMHSAILNRDFEIYVAEPSDHNLNEKAAVVYSLDGDSSFGMAAEIAQRLQMAGEMAPAYVVGIGYGAGPNRRDHDYVHEKLEDTPDSGGGAGFERFLLEELRPRIEARYPVDPARSVLAGHSFGGLFVAHVLVDHPNAFAGWLISSASLWVKDAALVKTAQPLAKAGKGHGEKVFLSVGQREGEAMIGPILKFGDALHDKASGFQVSGQVWDAETHASVVPFAYSRGFRMLLGPPHYGDADPNQP